MAIGGIYETGTVTIQPDRVSVIGVGTLWTPVIEIGDWLFIGGQVGLIGAVVDDTHLTLETQWQGTLPSAAVYVIVKMSWLRYDPALTQAKVRQLLEELHAQGNFLFVEGDVPDPAMGEDGQWALKTNVTPWQLWLKVDGVWVQQAPPAGMRWRGAWASTTTYSEADGVQYLGSSYISKTENTNQPPNINADDWDLMAAQGGAGPPGPPGVLADDSVFPPYLDADTPAKQLLFRDRLNFVSRSGDAMTGSFSTAPQTNSMVGLGSAIANLQVIGAGTAADGAFMTFHRPGSMATHFGMDADNFLKFGGFSLPNAYRVLHEGLTNPIVFADPTVNLGVATKQYVDNHAAPLDALAFNGMQVNGSMDVSQQYAPGFNVASGYALDGWSVAATFSVVGGQTPSNVPPGFQNSFLLQTAVAKPSLAAGDYFIGRQLIEGIRVARLNWGTAQAQPLTLAFWIFTSGRSGLFSGVVKNFNGSLSYPFTFTVNVFTAWEYKTVTIPGPTSGTWNKSNGIGIELTFAMGAGTNYLGTAGVWQAANLMGANGTTNNAVAANDYMLVTGVLLLPGTQAPSSDRAAFIMRPYDNELMLCQRYLEMWANEPTAGNYQPVMLGLAADANTADFPTLWRVRKRTTPSIFVSNVADFRLLRSGFGVPVASSPTGFSIFGPTPYGGSVRATHTGNPLTASETLGLAPLGSAAAKLFIDARL